jgi:ABC-type multidrug transport system fused ATPase/permease subunit
VQKGWLLGVTGPVGSGKSSLAAVLTGLYPYEGSIKVTGRELKTLANKERASYIAYSGQDSFLFSASIRENITFKNIDKDNDNIREILHISALAEDLELFPDGTDTMVGEKGIRISGGQRQRVSLSRAIYAGSPILILDDPFSAVDIGTEMRMIERLRENLRGKTIFLFSHRLSAFKNADMIIVLDKGRVAEQGTHAELVQKGGIYQKIYSAQDWMESEQNEYR